MKVTMILSRTTSFANAAVSTLVGMLVVVCARVAVP